METLGESEFPVVNAAAAPVNDTLALAPNVCQADIPQVPDDVHLSAPVPMRIQLDQDLWRAFVELRARESLPSGNATAEASSVPLQGERDVFCPRAPAVDDVSSPENENSEAEYITGVAAPQQSAVPTLSATRQEAQVAPTTSPTVPPPDQPAMSASPPSDPRVEQTSLTNSAVVTLFALLLGFVRHSRTAAKDRASRAAEHETPVSAVLPGLVRDFVGPLGNPVARMLSQDVNASLCEFTGFAAFAFTNPCVFLALASLLWLCGGGHLLGSLALVVLAAYASRLPVDARERFSRRATAWVVDGASAAIIGACFWFVWNMYVVAPLHLFVPAAALAYVRPESAFLAGSGVLFGISLTRAILRKPLC